MKAPASFNPYSLLSSVTDYAFHSKFNSQHTYNSTAFNRRFDEELSDLLNSDFQFLSTESQVAYLKAFLVKNL